MSRAEKEATWLFLRRKLQEWTSTVAEAQVSGDKRCERAEHQCSTLVSTSAQDKVSQHVPFAAAMQAAHCIAAEAKKAVVAALGATPLSLQHRWR